jgi:hypothetical protein
MLDFIYNFILGGSILSIIYYLTGVLGNPVLAAIVGTLPFNILSGYIISNRKVLREYYLYSFLVCCVTLLATLGVFYLIKNTNYKSYIIITFIMALWVVLQYILYKNKNFFDL